MAPPPEPRQEELARQQPPILLTHSQPKQESLLPEQEQQQASTAGSEPSDFYPTYDHKQVQYDEDVDDKTVTQAQPILYTEEAPQTAATQRRFVFVTKRPRHAVF